MTGGGPVPETVYDEEYVAGLPEWMPGQRNPWPATLCRSPRESIRKARQQIEDWYRLIPPERRARFYTRLRGFDRPGFVSALGELYVHQWLLAIARPVSVDYEPPVGKGDPDFVLRLADGSVVVCEVYSPHDVGGGQESAAIEDEFHRQCQRWLPKGSNLWLDMNETPDSLDEVEALVRALRECLGTRPEAGFRRTVDCGRLKCRVDVLPGGRPDRVLVNGWGTVACLSATHEHVQERLQEKASKFRSGLTGALVLFVIDETGWVMDEEDWVEVCYGPQQEAILVGEDLSQPISGKVLPRHGGLFLRFEQGRVHQAYVSAVVTGRHDWGADGLGLRFVGFANPLAKHPAPDVLLGAVPFWVPSAAEPGHLVRTVPGEGIDHGTPPPSPRSCCPGPDRAGA